MAMMKSQCNITNKFHSIFFTGKTQFIVISLSGKKKNLICLVPWMLFCDNEWSTVKAIGE